MTCRRAGNGGKNIRRGTVRLSADISRAGAFSECGLGNSSIGQQGRPLPQQLCEFRCSGEGAFGRAAAAEPALGVVKSHLNSLVVTCCD